VGIFGRLLEIEGTARQHSSFLNQQLFVEFRAVLTTGGA
jgi:hypothetical protein